MNPNTAGWRRRDARTSYEAHVGPNMTPMVDVVMVILIFFMASTVILGPEMLLAAGLEDKAKTDQPTDADPRFAIEKPVFEIRLTIFDGAVAVSGFGLTDAPLSQLAGAARALAADAGSGARIVINPDDSVPYEAVIRAQDMLNSAGLTGIGLR